MANNSAEHRTAEEEIRMRQILIDVYEPQFGKYADTVKSPHFNISYISNNNVLPYVFLAMEEYATQQVKAKDEELARVTKLLEIQVKGQMVYRFGTDWHALDKSWNDYKTKNEIR